MRTKIELLLSRAAMAILVLPASFFHYGGIWRWMAALARGKAFFSAVLNDPRISLAKVSDKPRFIRAWVAVPLSVAQQLRNNGGALPSWGKLKGVVKREGIRGMLRRLGPAVSVGDMIVASAPPAPFKMLVADARIPVPGISAADAAAFGVLRDLCELGFAVTFLPISMNGAVEHIKALEELGVTVVTATKDVNTAADYLARSGKDFASFYLIRVEVAEAMLDIIRYVAPSARVVFHAPDLIFLREAREAELRNDPVLHRKAEVTRGRELNAFRAADHGVVVSSAEVPVLRNAGIRTPLSVFPALYAPVWKNSPGFLARAHIFFLGGFGHAPNVDAVSWFAASVWPRVREQIPDMEFHIIGSFMPKEVSDLASTPGIKAHGFVENLEPLLARMRVSVAPLRYGAGIKGKVAMAMGAGVPCVCTSIATEGTSIVDGEHALVADDAGGFANAVVRLYSDGALWEKLAAAGRELVEHSFGLAANRESLLVTLSAARVLPLDLFLRYADGLPCASPAQVRKASLVIAIGTRDKSLVRSSLRAFSASSMSAAKSVEIIVVGTGTAEMREMVWQIAPDARIVAIEEGASNDQMFDAGVQAASTEQCLLLIPGTCLLPGAFVAMCEALGAADVAAVGPKQLATDGRLIQAGGLIAGDGQARPLGVGQGRDARLFASAGAVDYLPFDSMLVRRSAWISLRHAHEGLEGPSDLVFGLAAREQGWRLIYLPDAEVVLRAPDSDARESVHGVLADGRWETLLAQQPPVDYDIVKAMSHADRIPSPGMLARREAGRLNVLYFSPFPSHPASHGNRSTIKQFGECFRNMGHNVHFVLLESDGYSQSDVQDMRAAWNSLDILPFWGSAPMDPNGVLFDGWYGEGLGEEIRRLCCQYDIDVVFCSYIFQSKLLEFVPDRILKVIDTHDKMGDRYEMLKSKGQPLEFFSCPPAEEGRYLRRADMVVARREEEARYFDSVSGTASAIVVPHIEAPCFLDRHWSGLKRIGIVASANRINLALVLEFLQALDRALQGSPCPFEIHVAGEVRDMARTLPEREKELFEREWVVMHGFVDDIGQFYASVDLVVSPVTMGTGINVKTVQAMAYGMPLLTTRCGSKGIETGSPMHLHEHLDTLVSDMFRLAREPQGLNDLAELSRRRYEQFYEDGMASLRAIFQHPKVARCDEPVAESRQQAGCAVPTIQSRKSSC